VLILPFFMISLKEKTATMIKKLFNIYTLLGGDCDLLRREVIDVQVNLPAVLPCSDFRHSACQLPQTLLVQRRRVLTGERRQKGRLRVPRPGERRQSPLRPVDPDHRTCTMSTVIANSATPPITAPATILGSVPEM
uniref:Uncharacterized protein n=1 Tax=Stegastes partitus TaxID=144197 RepID=A0A3B4ZHZ1_9TELE